MQCEQCGSNMRLIPAGISKKTNKPYDAFFTCNDCKITAKAHGVKPEHQLGDPIQPGIDETIEKMRLWARGAQAKMNTLEQRIAILEKNYSEVINLIPLMEKIAGEPATTLHKSMSGKTIEEIAIEMGGKIVDDIPVIL